MKEILKLKRLYLLLLFPISGLLVLIARLSTEFVENVFVPINGYISFVLGTLVSFAPFSVTELLFVLGIAFLVYYIIKNYKKPLLILTNLLCTAAVMLFLFEIFMGLNYYRAEAKSYLDLDVKKSTVSELYNLCEILAKDMNEYRKECNLNSDGVVILSDKNFEATAYEAKLAYVRLADKYTFLRPNTIKCKPLISSRLFSHFMTTGLYFPYTFESNINVDVPEHSMPATMCHELMHYSGFMRENEANFLGYLACLESDRADFKYSASLMAFAYAYPRLYKEDVSLAKKISAMLEPGIIKDIAAEDDYWARFEGKPAATVTDKVYDGYLNANGQSSGTKSYGEMVDLLLAYYRE